MSETDVGESTPGNAGLYDATGSRAAGSDRCWGLVLGYILGKLT
jgi:hypothetical protein